MITFFFKLKEFTRYKKKCIKIKKLYLYILIELLIYLDSLTLLFNIFFSNNYNLKKIKNIKFKAFINIKLNFYYY